MKQVVLFIVLGLGLKQAFPQNNPANLSCVLRSNQPVYSAGEIPQFEVRIINNSPEAVYLPGCLDGSDMKWRYPYCYFTIEKPVADTPWINRCGTLNRIRAEDIRLVKPGESFNPFDTIDLYGFFSDYAAGNPETFKFPGTYKIRFHYSTMVKNLSDYNQARMKSGEIKLQPAISIILNKVPKVELTSNEIVIRIRE